MRQPARALLFLVIATSLALLLQFVEEEYTFPVRFSYPPGWVSVQRGRAELEPYGSGADGAVRLQGSIAQRILLLHGSGLDVRVSLSYRSPDHPAWAAVIADTTKKSVRELRLTADDGLQMPRDPTSDGRYRINLPSSATWRTVSFRVHPVVKSLPYLSLFLGCDRGSAEFSDVALSYINGPDEELLENGHFRDQWPTWARHPEWLTPPVESANTLHSYWAPARLFLAATIVLLLFILSPLKPSSSAGRLAALAAWAFSGSLLVMGSAALPDLARITLASSSHRIWMELALDLCFVVQMGLFFAIGVVGAAIGGGPVRYAALSIPVLAAMAMSASVSVYPQSGQPVHTADLNPFIEGIGPLWMIMGAAAGWAGVVCGCRWIAGRGTQVSSTSKVAGSSSGSSQTSGRSR